MNDDAPADVDVPAGVDEDLVDERPARRAPRRRSSTLAIQRLTRAELAIGQLLWPERVERPRARGECANVARPCPFVGCRHHLYLDLRSSGNVQLNYPGLEPWQLEASCSLDIADAGEHTLEFIAEVLGLTRERVRQIEGRAAAKCRRTAERLGFAEPDQLRNAPADPPPRKKYRKAPTDDRTPPVRRTPVPRGETYAGRPCAHGHVDETGHSRRYRNGSECVECVRRISDSARCAGLQPGTRASR